MIPTDIKTRQDRILDAWNARPCYICHERGICEHREYDVELALVDAELARASRPAKREPAQAPAAVPMKRRRA